MNPLQKNKIDISAMSEQEQKAFKLYGKLPAKNHLMKMQKDRKYFDSADHYSAGSTGREIPTPQAVQHTAVPTPGPTGNLSSSPTNHVPSPSPGAGSANSHAQAQPIGIPGQAQPFQHSQHRGSVGVGISPADNENHIDIPHQGHARRLSESHRISPPGTLRDGSHPSSSFPIQHHSGIGASSPVKASSLARRLDE